MTNQATGSISIRNKRGNEDRQSTLNVSESSPTEELLACSPSYTKGCELYPRAMRDTINGTTKGAVIEKRDPAITRKAEEHYRSKRSSYCANPDEELEFYPQVARRILSAQ